MVVRPRLSPLRMLFVLRGSVLPHIMPQLLGFTLLAVVVTGLHGQIGDWKVSLNFVPFSLIGLTLAIFLAFRNNTAYARYWEARTLWGSVLIECRTLTQLALTLNTNQAVTDQLVYRLCAFVHALRHQLRGTDASTDVRLFLEEAEAQRLLQARHPATMGMQLVAEWLGKRVAQGDIAPAVAPAFARVIAHLNATVGGCERIASNPIPFTYAVIIHRCIYLYCFWLPFGLIDSLGSMTPMIVCFIAYTFFTLEALGAEIEDPFGEDANDLPLSAMSHTIESSMLELMGELPRTPKPQVQDYILN